MAATQAEPTSEVTCDSDLNAATLQNGTEKGGGRSGEGGGLSAKAKSPGQGLPDMSQYRPEHGPPLANSEPPHANSVDAVKGMYHPGDPGDPNMAMQGYYPRPGYHHSPSDAHNAQAVNSDGNATYNQFGNQPGMRHAYPTGGGGGKAMPMGSPRPPAQPAGYGPAPPQRFMSGQPQGPTPTLNQLLQSNQPQQHYQNSYDYHGWGQRPGGYQPPGAGPPYRNQSPTPSSPRQGAQQPAQPPYYGPSPGGAGGPQVPPGAYPPAPSSPSPQQQQQQQQQPPQQQPPGQYPPYPGPGRYPTTRQPFTHQPISSYPNQQPPGGPGVPPPSGYPDQQQQPPPPQPQQQSQPGPQQQGPPGGQARQGWPHPPSPHPQPPQSPGHGPETQVPVPRPSPGPQASPGHPNHPPSPGPASSSQGGPPPPQSPHQQGSYPQRPQQASTPTAHAPDQGELSGANSNDSTGGPAGPGTPNSGMRPTPSPTGSTGSRSMSPAVGQQNIPIPPRPSSGQSEAQPPRLSHSPLTSGGGYPQPPHGAHQYKQPPYPQPNYSPRPGPGAPYSPAPAGYPQQQQQQQPNNQYAARPPHQPVTNHNQYPGYQGWGPQQPPPGQMMPGNHVPPNGKASGAPPSPAPPSPGQPPPANAGGPRPHTPPLYLKQHLQHKMAFSGPPPPPQGQVGYPGQGMGPPGGMHHPMGPPPPSGMHHPGMGPPPPQNMGPPHEMPPPPSSTPNSHPLSSHMEEPHDNGITTTAGAAGSHVSSASLGSVTSVVTTGPDGQPMDEGSQQSTLSNASAASGEEAASGSGGGGSSGGASGNTGGKVRKDLHGHPSTPQSTAPSPGSASANSMHEDYDVNSSPTSWPRTPNSPVFNSHVPSESYRSGKQPDSLNKLYEMDEAPERRHWLDRLLAFMEERRNPITACPTISKNPLDLFRLYLFVKERGGFMEVTKNKTWKDIAGLLGIGASSSAAYTLRKHYTKNLLAYECHFDRGGIDPQPIINQVEAQSKKKGNKVISVPSPGSSNSQDSFPPTGGSSSMDGYPGYGYPPSGANTEYPGSNQRPAQPNAPSPIPGGMQPGGYPGQPNYPGQYPDQYGRTAEYGQQFPQQGYPPSRPGPMYPQYPPSGPPGGPQEGDVRNYPQGGAGTPPGPGGPPPATGVPPTGAAPQDQYRNYPPGNYSGPRPGYPTPAGGNPAAPAPGAYPPNQAPQQEYYRQDQMYPSQVGSYPYSYGSSSSNGFVSYPNSQLARQLVSPQQAYGTNGNAAGGGAGSAPPPPGAANAGGKAMNTMTMPPPAPQPRRHPDFSKEQQPYQPYPGPPRPGYGPWPNNQFRQQYPQQWQGGPRYPTSQAPPNSYPPPQPMQAWGNSMPVPGVGQGSPLRPAGPRPPYRPQCPQMPPNKEMFQSASLPPGVGSKRDYQFPSECVESVQPLLFKRRRLNKHDVAPLEAWRIMMALRSGQLAETSWALDVLNILLFDDTAIAYFGLSHLPGLLEVLLEHWRKTLDEIFETPLEDVKPLPTVDLGEPIPEKGEKTRILTGIPDRTTVSLKGRPVVYEPRNDLFVRDGRRPWDVNDDSEPPDPAAHIISPYNGEIHLPFARRLPDGKNIKTEPSERTEPVRLPLRRRKDSHCEDECYSRDEATLLLVSEAQDSLARRCICLSTILRNLSFVPGNEGEMARSVLLLSLLGRLLLLHHDHPPRVTKTRNYDKEEDGDWTDSCSSLTGENEWWWEYLQHIRENVLVICANISGYMDVSVHAEELSRPILDGLLHWAVCPAAAGQDAFPTVGPNSVLSPQRLALEALCKLCVTEGNVDLLVATPPYSRLERLCGVLSKFLCRGEDQVLREMSVNLLHYLSSADSSMARTIALQPPSVSLLLSFVEQAEQSALGVANQMGIQALRDNPETMGTSLDMLRRAAGTLLHLARHPDNRTLFVQHEPRLLQLVMSQILDQQVACVLARVLFQVSRQPAVS